MTGAADATPPPIPVPRGGLVLILGARGAGKTTFALQRFRPTALISLQRLRATVADDEGALDAEPAARRLAVQIASERLARRRTTCVDGDLLEPAAWEPLVDVARAHHAPVVAIGLRLPEGALLERLDLAPGEGRVAAAGAVRRQARDLQRALAGLRRRKRVTVIELVGDGIDATGVEEVPLPCDRRERRGPFDVIGDVHGCAAELDALLARLGYRPQEGWRHPAGRVAVFVGDLTDRGPDSLGVLARVRPLEAAGAALVVAGNHDDKLRRWLDGRKVKATGGLRTTIAELEALPEGEREAVRSELSGWLAGLPDHLILDEGRLVVAHAGIEEGMIGGVGNRVAAFTRYGDPTGETVDGLPVRRDWAQGYRGDAHVVYGHTPTPEPRWRNRTVNVDQGCCFGGRLTALRWPEQTFVSVPARRTYLEPRGGFRVAVRPPRPEPAPELPLDAT